MVVHIGVAHSELLILSRCMTACSTEELILSTLAHCLSMSQMVLCINPEYIKSRSDFVAKK